VAARVRARTTLCSPEMTDTEVMQLQCKDMQLLSLIGEHMHKAKTSHLYGEIHM
jgi:hypothetical protein